jgi:hypothetical protein
VRCRTEKPGRKPRLLLVWRGVLNVIAIINNYITELVMQTTLDLASHPGTPNGRQQPKHPTCALANLVCRGACPERPRRTRQSNGDFCPRSYFAEGVITCRAS